MTELYTLTSLCTEKLLSPHQLREELPSSLRQLQFVQHARETIRRIFTQEDPRILLIAGPCSVHDITAAKEFASKLHTLAKQLEDSFFVVMRVHYEKPRSTFGWKGLVYDPFLDGSNDMLTGLRLTRELLLELTAMQVPIASEILEPACAHYFSDLISWGVIGARTCSSQVHRQIASALPIPFGFKNNTNGDIQAAVNGVLAAAAPQSFLGIDDYGHIATLRSQGNANCHIVLRGGHSAPNYQEESVRGAAKLLAHAHLPQRLLIDCSHDNSQRNHCNQTAVFRSVIEQILQGQQHIFGLMLESNLAAGAQQLSSHPSDLRYGVSITDPCLDWPTTERMMRWAHLKLKPLVSAQWEESAWQSEL